MKILTLVVSLAAVAWARPDVSHLFRNNYVPPVTSYGVPAVSVPTGGYLPPFTTSGISVGTSGVSSGSIFTSGQPSIPSVSVISDQPDYRQSVTQIAGVVPQPTEHRKSYYFYAAPDEPAPRIHLNIPIPAPQKRTNFIFVKAPNSPPQPVPIIVPQGIGSDTRTVVYVLVKKPDGNVKPIVVPGPGPSPPRKPEVVFVRYNTPEEAQHIVHTSLSGAENGPAIQDIDHGSFISEIQRAIANEKVGTANVGINLQPAPAAGEVDKVEGVDQIVTGVESSGVQINSGIGIGSAPSPVIISSTPSPVIISSTPSPGVVVSGDSGISVSGPY